MVNLKLHQKKVRAQFALIWLWLVFSAMVLMIILFLTWRYNQNKHDEFLHFTAKEIRLDMDDSIDDIIRNIAKMHFKVAKVDVCSQKFIDLMQQFVFDNPEVSGFYIADKQNQLLCSTMNDFDKIAADQSNPNPHIFGPYNSQNINKPYFIVQQALGDHYFGIYLLSSVLKKHMLTSSDSISQVLLFDSANNNSLITSDKAAQPSRPVNTEQQASKTVTSPLQSIENAQIIVKSNNNWLYRQLLQTELLFALVVIFFTSLLYLQFRKLLTQRFSLKGTIQNALKYDRFFPIYQPVYDPLKSKCVGAEVLVRWQTADNEWIQPDLFIEEAETSGLIVPITTRLIKKTYEECADILKQNDGFHLAFNLSKDHFKDKQFIDDMIALCEQYAVNPQQIILELTERQLLDLNDKQINTKIKRLRKKGFSLAIDDYGTGHASISYLQSFPFNYLKIDKIYTQSIGSGAITESLIDTIIEMAEKLQLIIIAEGVETHQQLEYLVNRKVHLIQGWLFAKAMHVDELNDYIKRS